MRSTHTWFQNTGLGRIIIFQSFSLILKMVYFVYQILKVGIEDLIKGP